MDVRGQMRWELEMWREHDSGVGSAGDIGGDWQVGEAFDKRFVRSDLPGSLYTFAIYVIRHEGNDGCVAHEVGKIELRETVEFMICEDPDDPGSTEIWADNWYSPEGIDDYDGTELMFSTVGEAETKARQMVEQFDATGVHWDGVDRVINH